MPADVSFNSGGIHKINSGETLVRAVGGGHHAAVLSDAGRVWTWGLDNHGQLGRPSVVQTNLPRLIQGDDLPDAWSSNPPVSIDLGFRHSVAVTGDGKVWTWGADTTTDLTDATYTGTDLTTPTEMPVTGLPAGDTVVAAAAGYNHAALLTAQGRILTFGLGDDGRLGLGDTATQESPGLVRLDAVSFGLRLDGYPAVGSVQTAVVTGASAAADYSYQWLRDGAAIAGGTGPTYRAVKKDLGALLSVRVTASPENRAASEQTATMSTPIGRQARITHFRITKTGKTRTLRAKVSHRKVSGWRPVPKGVKVRIRVLKDGRWVPAKRAKTTKTHQGGRVRVQITTHRKRTYRLVLPSKDHYQRAVSPTRRK